MGEGEAADGGEAAGGGDVAGWLRGDVAVVVVEFAGVEGGGVAVGEGVDGVEVGVVRLVGGCGVRVCAVAVWIGGAGMGLEGRGAEGSVDACRGHGPPVFEAGLLR